MTVAYDPAAKYHIEGEPDATIVEEEKTIPRTTKFIMEYKEGMWRMPVSYTHLAVEEDGPE